MHFSRGSSLLHAVSTSGSDQKSPQTCTKGYIHGYTGAPKCAFWTCECPLNGKCAVPAPHKVCSKPCKKHFPEPYKCMGGRGRIMPNGCVIWQCNCPWSVAGKCIRPDKTPYGEVICKDPCTVHTKNPKCADCGKELTEKESEDYEPWRCCTKCNQ